MFRDDRFRSIRDRSRALISNVDDIKVQREALIVLAAGRENLRQELADVRTKLDDTLVPAIDDQLFYTITGYRELKAPAAEIDEHFSPEEVDRYRLLAELQADANIATELLGNAFTLSDAASVEPLRERFESAVSRIERNLGALQGFSGSRRNRSHIYPARGVWDLQAERLQSHLPGTPVGRGAAGVAGAKSERCGGTGRRG